MPAPFAKRDENGLKLNAVLNNASVAIFLMDAEQHCSYLNAAAEKLTGFSLEEVRDKPLHNIIHHTRPDGTPYPLEECPIDRAFPQNMQMQGEEVFIHKNGTFFPVAYTASPIRDSASQTVGTVIEVRDITARKAAERRQQTLINELNHRVKNTLTTVMAIATQSFEVNRGRVNLEIFYDRLIALAKAHDILTRQNWESTNLCDIVTEVIKPHVDGSVGAYFDVSGTPVALKSRMVLPMTMILHELCTNALKYGALSSSGGRINLSWEVHDQQKSKTRSLHMRWQERGGPLVTPPERAGFGTRLIEREMARDLGGTASLIFEPKGLVCELNTAL